MEYDVAIIGAGPAGLTAGIYSARYGLKTVVFEDPSRISQLAIIPFIENYPGYEGTGMDLITKMKDQAIKFGAEHRVERVEDVRMEGVLFYIKTDLGEYRAKAIIIATGGKHRELGIEGEKEFVGRGVSYCAVCDGFFFKGRRVIVIGGGNSALADAIYLKELGCDVMIVHRRDKFRAEKALEEKVFDMGIEVLWNSVVERIEGSGKVERVVVKNVKTGERKILEVDGVFIAVGIQPQTEIASKLGIEMDSYGYIKVDKFQRTNVKGVFAAGDCCDNPLKQVVTACGDGAIAASSAYEYIQSSFGGSQR